MTFHTSRKRRLSVDECRDIVGALHKRFPHIKGPHQEDICYATQNRQNAVKELSKLVDVILVIGSPNSSNSNRLRELGEQCGIASYLIDAASDINPAWLTNVKAVGITAGASAPEVLVEEVVTYLKTFGTCRGRRSDCDRRRCRVSSPQGIDHHRVLEQICRGSGRIIPFLASFPSPNVVGVSQGAYHRQYFL